MEKVKDISGQKFGRLTAIERKGTDQTGHSVWFCECECGNEIETRYDALTSGSTKSCGCLKDEIKNGATKNGKITRLYRIWIDMKRRCQDRDDDSYRWYGDQGVKVCDEWNNFSNFRTWSLENGYNEDLELDRKDPKGDYSPENCRWISHKENCRNRHDSITLIYKGEKKTLARWAEELGIQYDTLYARVERRGWSTEKALTTPVGGSK